MKNNVLVKIAGAWAACVIIGMIIGKANSPNFDKKENVEDYIEKNIEVSSLQYAPFQEIKGLKTSDGSKVGIQIPIAITAVTFDAGRYTYVFSAKSEAPVIMNNKNHEPVIEKNGLQKEDFEKLISLAGLPAGYSLMAIKPIIQKESASTSAWIIAGCVVGAGLGYQWAYTEDFDVNTSLAQEVLQDPVFWKGVIQRKKIPTHL